MDDMARYKAEEKKREKGRVQLLNAHVREIAKRKADAYNIGNEVGEDYISSKTDKGRMTTSRHPKTGEIHHVWHDEPKIVTEKSPTRSRGNSQMRDDRVLNKDNDED